MAQHAGVGEGRQDAARHPSNERVSVPQAADHLGTAVDALRKCVQRGTIPYEKVVDGRVWILLDTGRPRQDKGQDTTGQRPTDSTALLIAELQDRVRSLEEANRENRRFIAALTQRILEIEAPASPEPPGGPPSAGAGAVREDPRPAAEAPRRAQSGHRERVSTSPGGSGCSVADSRDRFE
jgi:hypothetical protein